MIALFVNGPAGGHVYPTLGLVEELIADGDRVVYLSSESYRPLLERLGADFYAYEDAWADEDPMEAKQFLQLVIRLLRSYDAILPAVDELTGRYRFDYLICDSMYGCGRALAERLQLPLLSVCTSFVHAERMTGGEEARARFRENFALMNQFARLASDVQSRFGLRKRPTVDSVFFAKGDVNLVLTSEAFHPAVDGLDDSFRFVGACPAARPGTGDVLALRRGKPIVYISMGTQYNNDPDFYRLCFAAFADFDGQVILATGSRIDRRTLGEAPRPFEVAAFVPQLELLPQVDLFITHGGLNSVSEALLFGVPLLVIPQAADQPINAGRVAELGAGVRLERTSVTAQSLREAAERLLANPAYRERSREIGATLRDAGGPKRALAEVRRFKRLFVAPAAGERPQ